MTDTRRVPCEIWSRVVGYLRPTQDWPAHKQAEFHDRVTFRVVEKGKEDSLLTTGEKVV